MNLKFFVLLMMALLFSSCEDRAKPHVIACTGDFCDTDGDGLLDTDPKETDLRNPCIPKQDSNYTNYDNTNAIWIAGDCDNDGYTNGQEDQKGNILSNPYDYNSSCFLFKTKTYCETKLDEIWLDRNIDADVKCDGVATNKACFGGYYQWGRMTDGHEKSDSQTISNTAITLGDKFATYSIISENHDWNIYTDHDGSERATTWNADHEDALCPAGWKIPEIELLKEAGAKALDIPMAGYRAGQNGVIAPDYAALWSSSIEDTTKSLFIYDLDKVAYLERTNAFPVRCVKVK